MRNPNCVRSSFFVALTCALFMAGAASAGTITPGTYRLFDHGFGVLGPDYGLRVDSIGEVFSVDNAGASVLLVWNGGATATLNGTVVSLNDGDIWTVNYTVGNIVPSALGFEAYAGNGTIRDPGGNITVLTGEGDAINVVFRFFADGHRIPGNINNMVPVARGWFLPPGSTDDWLVRAQKVPEPASALMLGAALLAALGIARGLRR